MTPTTRATRTAKASYVLAGLVLLAGCSTSSTKATTSATASATASATTPPGGSAPSTSSSPAVSKADALDISGFSYDPSPLTVKAGATVTVTNQDSADHTVDSDVASLFTSGNVARGTPVTFVVPKKAGSYTFHCAYHPRMHGTLVVTG